MEEQDKKKLEAVKLRMEKLAEELEKHDKAYYIDNAPTVSDEIYDSLFQELARLDALHSYRNGLHRSRRL